MPLLLLFLLLSLAAPQPAAAYHYPWDQAHDKVVGVDPHPPGPDPKSHCDTCNAATADKASRSPVYAAAGHAIWQETDVMLRGRPSMGVFRAYNSNDPVVGLFGNGWSVDFDVALYPANNSGIVQRVFRAANGKRLVYERQADGSFKAPAARFEIVTETATSVTLTSLDGSRMVFAPDGRLIERYDTNNNKISYGYDTALRPNKLDDGNGRTLTIAYNSASLVASVTDHTGRTWRYGYDTNGNLITVTDPAGGQRSYSYQAYRPVGDAYTYYQLTGVKDATGVFAVQFAYTANQVSQYSEGQNVFTYVRSSSNTSLGGTVTRTDSLNARTSFVYGTLGLVTQDTDAMGGVTAYTLDANGRATLTKDALGRNWTASYDALGRMTSSSNPLNQASTITYAGNDPRPVKITSPSGRVVTLAYDSRGNLVTATDPAGNVTRMAYSSQGDVTAITNALTQQTTVAYTAQGLPNRVTDPLGRQSVMTYDALGRVATAANPAGETTRYAYDVLDRVVSVTDPLNQVTSFAFDAAGRLTQVTDAKGSITKYEYDSYGRRSAEVAPDGRRTGYVYRADNLPQTITWPDNTSISYQYDNNKRVTREVAGNETITYSYNVVNQLTSATGPGGTVSYTYDNAGRVATETSGGKTNTISRNAEGERTKLDYLGQSLAYTRDARGLVSRIAAAAGNFDFTFDALGRRSKLNYPNGSTASYAFDAAGQLTNLTHAGVFNAPYAHTFDAAGRISRITGDGPDWNYTYDALGRLTRATQGATTYTYTLDAAGNILDGGRIHDANHRLTADAAKSYSYDDRGNLTLQQDSNSGARTVYTWNVKNQLRQLQFFSNATTTTASRTLVYSYDPLGRRASRTDNGVVLKFAYDGDDLVGTLDSGNNVTEANVFSGAIDEPLASTMSGSTKTLYANHVGSIKAVADGTVLSNSYSYGPYGETIPGGSPDSTPFRYTGREKETDDLYYYRARYYSASLKRFTQADPLGWEGGMNLYSYVDGSPIGTRDPSGKSPDWDFWWETSKFVAKGEAAYLDGWIPFGNPLAYIGAYDENCKIMQKARSDGEEWGSYSLIAAALVVTPWLAPEGLALRGGIQTVTHWGPAGMNALRAGDWVMTGGQSLRNFRLSGVQRYAFKNAITREVAKDSLSYPRGWEWIKGLLGQRIYTP
jgi:RHS repeat-associated protein